MKKTDTAFNIPKCELMGSTDADIALCALQHTQCTLDMAVQSLNIIGLSTDAQELKRMGRFDLITQLAVLAEKILRHESLLTENDTRKVLNSVCRIGGEEMMTVFIDLLKAQFGVSIELKRLIVNAPFHSSLYGGSRFGEYHISTLMLTAIQLEDVECRQKAMGCFVPTIRLHVDHEPLIAVKLLKIVEGDSESEATKRRARNALQAIQYRNDGIARRVKKALGK